MNDRHRDEIWSARVRIYGHWNTVTADPLLHVECPKQCAASNEHLSMDEILTNAHSSTVAKSVVALDGRELRQRLLICWVSGAQPSFWMVGFG